MPRRSCDPSQRADRVGSDDNAWADVCATCLFLGVLKKAVSGCVAVRIFFRETGTPEHTGSAAGICIIRHRGSRLTNSDITCTDIAGSDRPYSRVGFCNERTSLFHLGIIAHRIELRQTYTQKKD